MVIVEALSGPFGGRPRVRVEPVEAEKPGDGVVVIAARDPLSPLGHDLDARERVGAVTDEVAEREHRVGARRRVGEDGLERFQVAVNVGEHRVPHA